MGFREVTTLKESGRTEVEVSIGKLKNGKSAGKDELTGEIIIKGESDRVVDYI